MEGSQLQGCKVKMLGEEKGEADRKRVGSNEQERAAKGTPERINQARWQDGSIQGKKRREEGKLKSPLQRTVLCGCVQSVS